MTYTWRKRQDIATTVAQENSRHPIVISRIQANGKSGISCTFSMRHVPSRSPFDYITSVHCPVHTYKASDCAGYLLPLSRLSWKRRRSTTVITTKDTGT